MRPGVVVFMEGGAAWGLPLLWSAWLESTLWRYPAVVRRLTKAIASRATQAGPANMLSAGWRVLCPVWRKSIMSKVAKAMPAVDSRTLNMANRRVLLRLLR